MPVTIPDNGAARPSGSKAVYLQDEWKVIDIVTVNYGLRFDNFTAYDTEHQLQSARERGVAARRRYDGPCRLRALLLAAVAVRASG